MPSPVSEPLSGSYFDSCVCYAFSPVAPALQRPELLVARQTCTSYLLAPQPRPSGLPLQTRLYLIACPATGLTLLRTRRPSLYTETEGLCAGGTLPRYIDITGSSKLTRYWDWCKSTAVRRAGRCGRSSLGLIKGD